jgi:alginate O-acetyltransferase complex protein AlgI
MRNFKRPYFAANIQDFWRRWHISLSTWFRDYVYIPLGGNRVSISRGYLNLLIIFVISGIWHGANYTYLIWGGLHGLFMIGYSIIKPYLPRFPDNKIAAGIMHAFYMAITLALVTFAWIFFRANTVGDAFMLISNLKTFGAKPITIETHYLVALVLLFIVEVKMEYFPQRFNFFASPYVAVRWGCVIVAIFLILLLGVYNGKQFIYFQF